MMNEQSETEEIDSRIESLLGRLRRDAEKRGWQFYVQPPPEVIPDFLEGYRPDALAFGPDGGSVIEIRSPGHAARNESLVEIAGLVEAQRGWSFRNFYLAPPIKAVADIVAPTEGELASGLVEARALLKEGHERAALVMAWSLLEATARLVTPQEERSKTHPLSPIQAVQTLAEMGYLEEADARRLRALTELRNAVVHGSLGTFVPASAVAALINDLEEITHFLKEAA